jgi:hypothetical protein
LYNLKICKIFKLARETRLTAKPSVPRMQSDNFARRGGCRTQGGRKNLLADF